MAHHHTPIRIAALALSAVVVTGSVAGLTSYSNAKYADALGAARVQSIVQPAQTAIAPLRIDVVGRRIAV